MAVEEREFRLNRVIVLFLIGLLVFVLPFKNWWVSLNVPWYLPFALWLLLIVAYALLVIRRTTHDV